MTLVGRHRGAVCCAHCGGVTHDARCPECGRLVCPACHDDPGRCPDPRPRNLRLGVRARAIDVDATGRYVLFVDWYGTCRVLDLQRQQRAAAPKFLSVARQRLARGDAPRAAMLPSGDVVSFESLGISAAELGHWEAHPLAHPLGSGELGYGGLRMRSTDGTDRVIQVSDGSSLSGVPRGVFASDDGRYVLGLLARGGESTRLDLVDSGVARLQAVRTVPGELTAIATDAARSIVALATTHGVQFHDLRTLQPSGSSVASPRGKLRALAIAERTLVLAGTDLELYRWDGQSLPSWWAPPETHEAGRHRVRGPGQISLTRDGQLLAVCVERCGVAVLHLAGGSRQLLLERGAAVDLVRFVDNDRRLFVATADGRVHTWHRRGDRIATR